MLTCTSSFLTSPAWLPVTGVWAWLRRLRAGLEEVHSRPATGTEWTYQCIPIIIIIIIIFIFITASSRSTRPLLTLATCTMPAAVPTASSGR